MSPSSARPYREFGSWLRSRRLARRWTQDELARRIDYHVTYVRKIEWGERRATEALRVRLAQELGVPVSSLPPAEPARQLSRLPDVPGRLIGRSAEVADVVALLEGGARLVTVLGAPGIGKTRLALSLASHLDDQLAGGARFVPLVGATDRDGVLGAVARALDLAVVPGGDDLERVVGELRAQDLLLVLDNFEHVVDAAPLVGELLAGAPTLRVLVTSRQPLGLRAETQYRLQPLQVPDRSLDAVGELADVPAVALFVASAGKVRPGFALDESNARFVAEICALLEGIPLAVELAAATSSSLAPEALLARLRENLDLPVAGPRDVPEHQRTLRAAIGWSLDLLGPAEQVVMRRLAVFVGGCTLETAAAVCPLPDDPGLDPAGGVLALVDKSLLQPVPYEGDRARFSPLETVRTFALERLEAAGELEPLRRRHAACFLELAEACEPRLTGSEQAGALAVLEAEHANLGAAIGWSLEDEGATATRLCAALWRFWWIRGHVAEGRNWLDAALAQPQRDPSAQARALAGAGVLAQAQGAYAQAGRLLEHAGALARAIDDRSVLALALINLGNVALHRGEHIRAAELFEESRLVSGGLGDERGVGHSLNSLGTARLGEGDFDTSAELFDQALSIFTALDDTWSVATVLTNLGWVAHAQGRSAVARSFYEKGLALYRALGDERGVANMLVNLGMAADADAGGDAVVGLFEEALLIRARLGERRGVAECLEALAAASGGVEPGRTAVLLGAADALRRGIGASLWPEEKVTHRRVVDVVRGALGDASFDLAWQRGRILRTGEVLAVALTRPAPSGTTAARR